MRRLAVLIVIASVSPAVAMDPLVPGTTPPAPPTWPQFGGPSGDFRTTTKAPAKLDASAVRWRVPIGLGESSVIGDGRRLYTMFGTSDAADRTTGTEHVVALDPKDGKTLWEHKYAVGGLPKGDTPVKGGRCGPQASPCVVGDRVVAVGYTGRVTALDAATGKVLWAKELVADFGGERPEFGFASSPVPLDQLVLVPVGGKKTALVALDPADGAEKWRTAAERASCCTPQVVSLAGVRQVVHMTRSVLHGYSPTDGRELWAYNLPLVGLTNVPSPLVLPNDRVVISGQGVKGMRLLAVMKAGDTFAVKEAWKSDPQFFYCNWGVADDVLYGYGGSAFVAVRLKDGEVLWSDKGWKDANWLPAGGPVVLRGDGRLARCEFTDTGVKETAGFAASATRTWTPPSVVGDTLYVRNTTELVAVSLAGR